MKYLPNKRFVEMASIGCCVHFIGMADVSSPKSSIPLVEPLEVTVRTIFHINPMDLLMRIPSVAPEFHY